MASLLATPTPSALAPAPLLGALVLILLAVAVFTAVPALRAGRVNTVDALALGRAGGDGRHAGRGAERRGDLPPRDRRPVAARQAVRHSRRARRRGHARARRA